jgi:hypothetical protein
VFTRLTSTLEWEWVWCCSWDCLLYIGIPSDLWGYWAWDWQNLMYNCLWSFDVICVIVDPSDTDFIFGSPKVTNKITERLIQKKHWPAIVNAHLEFLQGTYPAWETCQSREDDKLLCLERGMTGQFPSPLKSRMTSWTWHLTENCRSGQKRKNWSWGMAELVASKGQDSPTLKLCQHNLWLTIFQWKALPVKCDSRAWWISAQEVSHLPTYTCHGCYCMHHASHIPPFSTTFCNKSVCLRYPSHERRFQQFLF